MLFFFNESGDRFILSKQMVCINQGTDIKKTFCIYLTVNQSKLYVRHPFVFKRQLSANQLSTFHGNVR